MSKKYKFLDRRYQSPYKERATCGICGSEDVFWSFCIFEDKWKLIDKDGKHRCKHEEGGDEDIECNRGEVEKCKEG